jgi:hypothetical protein
LYHELTIVSIFIAAAVVVAAKTTSDPSESAISPDPNSPASTITTVVREIIARGGTATAIQVDVRSVESTQNLIDKTIAASLFSSLLRLPAPLAPLAPPLGTKQSVHPLLTRWM